MGRLDWHSSWIPTAHEPWDAMIDALKKRSDWPVIGIGCVLLIVLITAVHFLTDQHEVAFHNVYRRLNYIPIVLGAFAYGLRGGIGFGLLAGAAYVPHAFFATHIDPAPTADKVLEIVLYVAIGALTGWLVERQRLAQRHLERALEERDALETQLVRAGKLSALGELTAGLAHEIRNPLASISGSADAIAAEFDASHATYPMVEVLLREIRRLDRVVSRFLEFARPTISIREVVDLRALSDELVSLTEEQAARRGVEVTAHGGTLMAEVDADRVKQVILNLLLNAFEACAGTSGAHVEVRTETRGAGERRYDCIVVSDNGHGIPETERGKIFDPYFTTHEGGTGLGLSISERIMGAHEGFLDFETSSDGTEFWVCFPAET